jgi:hypothetical protein
MTTTEKAICEAHNVDRSRCTKKATVTVHWPGRSIVMCSEHAVAATKVADAMGFDLTIITLVLALVLAGCGVDAFTAEVPEGGDVAADSGQASGDSAEGGGADSGASLEGGGADVVDASAADSGEACPMIGAACAPVGLRKCRSQTNVWYCAGTWTSSQCTQGNPACAPCDAGYCCIASPVCP